MFILDAIFIVHSAKKYIILNRSPLSDFFTKCMHFRVSVKDNRAIFHKHQKAKSFNHFEIGLKCRVKGRTHREYRRNFF